MRPAAGAALTAVRAAVVVGSALAAALTAQAVAGSRALRTPSPDPPAVAEAVSVLLPVRDEERHVLECLRAVLASTGVPDLEVLVLDDASTDASAALVAGVAATEDGVRAAADQAADGTNPPSDLNGDSDYRKHLATVLTRRAVLKAAGA